MVAVCHRAPDVLAWREIMMRNLKLLSIALLVGTLALWAEDRRAERIIWVDADMENIPEPSERHVTFAEYVVDAQFMEQGKRALDIPRWARFATGNPKPAANVNALDEVPNSSWYTNRLHLQSMSTEELVRGT